MRCPGPVAAMIGQGRLAGIVIVAGLLLGVSAHGALSRHRGSQAGRSWQHRWARRERFA